MKLNKSHVKDLRVKGETSFVVFILILKTQLQIKAYFYILSCFIFFSIYVRRNLTAQSKLRREDNLL